MAAHQNTWMVGVGMVVIFGLLNAIGVEIFGKVEVVLTFGMWTTLTIFGLCGIFMAPVTHLSGWFGTPLNVSDLNGLFGYIGMAMFMFVGCELVTPMAPEIKQAHRTIPRAMALGLLGVASCMFIYGAAINRQVENVVLDAANNVHLLDTPMAIPAFAERVMGHAGQYWLGVGLLLAGCDH
jgi:amino acid transporter